MQILTVLSLQVGLFDEQSGHWSQSFLPALEVGRLNLSCLNHEAKNLVDFDHREFCNRQNKCIEFVPEDSEHSKLHGHIAVHARRQTGGFLDDQGLVAAQIHVNVV